MESGLLVLRRFRGDLGTVLNCMKDYEEKHGDQCLPNPSHRRGKVTKLQQEGFNQM